MQCTSHPIVQAHGHLMPTSSTCSTLSWTICLTGSAYLEALVHQGESQIRGYVCHEVQRAAGSRLQPVILHPQIAVIQDRACVSAGVISDCQPLTYWRGNDTKGLIALLQFTTAAQAIWHTPARLGPWSHSFCLSVMLRQQKMLGKQ